MKRSEINTIMRDVDAFLKEHKFCLPPFAYWTARDWAAKGGEVREIVHRQLGWDITDFGSAASPRLRKMKHPCICWSMTVPGTTGWRVGGAYAG